MSAMIRILLMNAVNVSNYSVPVTMISLNTYFLSYFSLQTDIYSGIIIITHAVLFTLYFHYNLMYTQVYYYSNFTDEENEEQVPGHKDSKEWWN